MTSPFDDPRVQPDVYLVRPTGYDEVDMTDKYHWQLHVTNGHAFGWSVRRYREDPYAMNRKGKFIQESRGHRGNRYRRYPLEEALQLALKHVDSLTVMNLTLAQAAERLSRKP